MGCSPSSNEKEENGDKGSEEEQRQQQQEQHVLLNSHSVLRQQLLAGNENKLQDRNETTEPEPPPGKQSSSGNLISLGPMSIFRPRQLNVVGAFPRPDPLSAGLETGIERLKWSLRWIKASAPSGSSSTTGDLTGRRGSGGGGSPGEVYQLPVTWQTLREQCGAPTWTMTIDLFLLDYRAPKLLPPDCLDLIKCLKSQHALLVVVAFVKKSFFDKSETAVNLLLEAGIDKVEIDHGITDHCFWMNELSQLEKSFVDTAYKLITTEALIRALDQCRDLIQITDSHHRIQFVNQAYEKLFGVPTTEVIGSELMEVQHQSSTQSGESIKTPTSGTGQVMPPIVRHDSTTSPTTTSLSPFPRASLPFTRLSPQSLHDHAMDELKLGKTWEGNYVYSRKAGEPVTLHSRVLPFSYRNRARRRSSAGLISASRGSATDATSPSSTEHLQSRVSVPPATHYIYFCEAPHHHTSREKLHSDLPTSQDTAEYSPMPRGSLKSLRKASYDVKSFGTDNTALRRQSVAKLHSLTIEAPITKVINIIAAAQQSCPIYIAEALEKVLEILRTTEIYSPHFFEGNRVRSDDPLTTDLLGALLSQTPKSASTTGRRPSHDITLPSRLAPRPSLANIAETPTRLQSLLETEVRWDFDVLLLEKITEKRPLVWTGMAIFSRFGVAQTLNTDERTLRNWLTLIEANYHSTNTYHNSTHAADVLQATAYFMSTERLKSFLEPLDEVVSLLAAVVHDVDHPGKTSGYLTNSGNELSLLYNDVSILESHHAAFAFKLTLSDQRVNIFKNLDTETYKTIRRSLIDMVLATEMTKHFEHLCKFVNVFTKPLLEEEEVALVSSGGDSTLSTSSAVVRRNSGDGSPRATTPTEPDISTLLTTENVILIKRMLIKCADVANPTRPLKLCVEWARRIAEEYFRQTDDEISRGLPPVMPMFERETCSIPKSQIGFVDYFVADMFEAWDAFLDVPEAIDNMKYNYEFWKELDRKGIQSAGQVEAYLRRSSSINQNK